MTAFPERHLLYRGDRLLGTVTIVGTDQPYFCGHIELAAGCDDIRQLLDELAQNHRNRQASNHSMESQLEWGRITEALIGPGLRIVDEVTGELEFEPTGIDVDERGFWWTGRVCGARARE